MHRKSKNRAQRRSSGHVETRGGRSRKRAAGHTVQVYIDIARTFAPVTTGISDKTVNSVKNESSATVGNDGSVPRNGADRESSVDKQIEEKFSRISDALKEDEAGLKATTEQTTEMTTEMTKMTSKETKAMSEATSHETIAQNKVSWSFHGDSEPRNKFNELNDASRRRNNEAAEEANADVEPLSNVNAGEPSETFPGDGPESPDQPIEEYDEANKNLDLHSGSLEDDSGGARLLANQFGGSVDAGSTGTDLVTDRKSVV